MEYAREDYNKADFFMDIGRRDQFYQHQTQAGVERGSTIGFHGYFGGKFKLGKSCVAVIKWLKC